MIKPVSIVNQVVKAAEPVVNTTVAKTSEETAEITREAARAKAELLQAYKGVVVKRLFSNVSEFVDSASEKLSKFKENIPKELFDKLSEKINKKEFSLEKTVSEYYSGLNDCKTLEQVKKAYPEIKVPNLNLQESLADAVRAVIPKSVADEVAGLKTVEEKQQHIAKYLDNHIEKQVKNWEIYPEFQKIRASVEQEVVKGKFVPGKLSEPVLFGFNQRMPLRFRLMHTKNPEESLIQILRENYVQGKPLSSIVLKTTDGKEIPAFRLRHNLEFSSLDKNFRQFIKSTDKAAQEFKDLTKVDNNIISSAIMTKTWATSRLRADLGNMTGYNKNWSLVKAVWHKTMFPAQTNFPTDKLIDFYLVNMFKAGIREPKVANPFEKLAKQEFVDKRLSLKLKSLYHGVKSLENDKIILKTPAYQEFKAKFDLKGMAKSIESVEEHYKNAFFKIFWDDSRKARFAEALHANRDIAQQNIEISNSLLTQAMDNVFESI